MQGKPNTVGPVALTGSALDIYHNTSALIFDLITHIRVTNTSALAATVTVGLGTVTNTISVTLIDAEVIPPHTSINYYCRQKLTSTQFLIGLRDASSTANVKMESEQFVA